MVAPKGATIFFLQRRYYSVPEAQEAGCVPQPQPASVLPPLQVRSCASFLKKDFTAKPKNARPTKRIDNARIIKNCVILRFLLSNQSYLTLQI